MKTLRSVEKSGNSSRNEKASDPGKTWLVYFTSLCRIHTPKPLTQMHICDVSCLVYNYFSLHSAKVKFIDWELRETSVPWLWLEHIRWRTYKHYAQHDVENIINPLTLMSISHDCSNYLYAIHQTVLCSSKENADKLKTQRILFPLIRDYRNNKIILTTMR
jgi:hypothetical protein